MSVSATFQPDRVVATPGDTVALTLQLQNLTADERMVTLRTSGGLAAQTVLQTETIYLDPNENFEVPVVVDAASSLPAGAHACVVDVDDAGQVQSATATIEIGANASYTARLEPPRSSSGNAGRHKVAIENTGNVALTIELVVDAGPDVAASLAAPLIDVEPGSLSKVELRVQPRTRYWSGDEQEHPFVVDVRSSSGENTALDGVFVQRARVPSWLVPALAGMVGSLILGTLAWFLLLRPAVESIAEDEARELDAAQSAEIQEQVDEMQRAVDEARQLPLGQPVDQRLDVSVGPAESRTTSFVFDQDGSDRVLSITDIILQNPTGAVGTIEFLRNDEVLQSSNLANFRDLDFHLIAPYRVESRDEIGLRISCDTPGPGTAECAAAATILGFVDDR